MAKINFARPLMKKKHPKYFNLATLVSSAFIQECVPIGLCP